jgi:hypothetical protein
MRHGRFLLSLRACPKTLLCAAPKRCAWAFVAVLACACAAAAQTPGACKTTLPPGVKADAPVPAGEKVGIQLVALGPDGKPLQRKRFFLLGRSAAPAFADAPAAPRRADYLKGASPQLVEWLGRHDCDSLYCPEYEAEYAAAAKTVPEFRRAYEEGVRKYRSESLALRWITVNFPLKDARTAYYKRKRAWLENTALKLGGAVASVMTDEKGKAYFTGLKPGTYYVSNLAPLEPGGLVWDCAVTTAPQLSRLLYSVTVEMSAPKRQATPPK